MKAAREKLVEKEVNETYPDLGYKIEVKPGKTKYKINNKVLINKIGQNNFNEIATVSQAALEREYGHMENYDEFINSLTFEADSSKDVQSYISVSKLNMEERKEVKSCPKRRRIAHKKED